MILFSPLDLNVLVARLPSSLLTEVYEDDLLRWETSLYLFCERDLDDRDLDCDREVGGLRDLDLVYDLEDDLLLEDLSPDRPEPLELLSLYFE